MKHSKMLALFDVEQRRDVRFYPFRVERTPQMVRHLTPNPEQTASGVIYSKLTADNRDNHQSRNCLF